MFDFENSTYSGLLSIIATLFGLSYPLIIGCIEKIDDRFGSTKLSERFMNEKLFKCFKKALLINIIIAILIPFLMNEFSQNLLLPTIGNNRIYEFTVILIQCLCTIVLVVLSWLLFKRILTYYNVDSLQKDILRDYKESRKKQNKELESRYFTQWIDLSKQIIGSSDEKLVQRVYEELVAYAGTMQNENKNKELVFDQYFYEGICHINEFLSKGESKPISLNNRNFILTSLILPASIDSATTYRYLWRNLRVQMFYNKDEWIMAYWEYASEKINYYMQPILQGDHTIEGELYTEEQIESRQKQRDAFLEFHIMLCAMLMQEKKYKLLERMLSFTQSIPPNYPLVPSTLRDIIDVFKRINRNICVNPFYFESMYQMPNMHGITDGKIVGAANCYLALLVYRIYRINWNFGPEYVLSTGALPNNLSELRELNDNLDALKYWLNSIKDDKELLNVVRFRSFDEEIADKKQGYSTATIYKPDELISKMRDTILATMKDLRINQELSKDKVFHEKNELENNISKAMKPYEDLLERSIPQGKSYYLNSSIRMPFPNTAFLENSDMSYCNIAECMSSYMLQEFQHLFASCFYQEHSNPDYKISSEDLFAAIDGLELNDQHYIIAFGIYFDHYIGSVKELKKETVHNYSYKGIKILNLHCSTEYFSQVVYVMRFEDRPFLEFQEPSQEERQKLCLREQNKKYGLWLSLEKIHEHSELLDDKIQKSLGVKADEYSLFTAIWKPKLCFKTEKYPIVSIKVKYRLTDEGNYDTVDKVKPFTDNKLKFR